ncbi:nucleotide 5'-monophosphate nucleosidase PpnN [Ruminobacter sp. RM87]|uniref:nucleotide 5'-monophosphate nucleosidase PpnN n=1 Tax=Ruminobacter sp. RM87 TaxID=1200567 RepID=UPI0004E0B4AE|nr:nucleotide 5'-monophosphate nucleosidase PpnN [Ruminobacter sp. RM87]
MISVIQPPEAMALLSQIEAESLSDTAYGELYDLYRNCSLAVLNSGVQTDNAKELLDKFSDFDIKVVRNERGVKLELINPPRSAFVDGEIITSIQINLYAVLRDIIRMSTLSPRHILPTGMDENALSHGKMITNVIFSILRSAQILVAGKNPNTVVCWGGHSISKAEYDYAYNVGVQLGLRKFDICTGCGPGVMEAPMVGANFGQSKQNSSTCRFVGLTEPSIIAAEPPNAMVSNLVILPDIEKRLEAFVRFGNAIIVFPGGPGTVEELLYILSIKLLPANRHEQIPLILTGGRESEDYFNTINRFIMDTLGEKASRAYKIIIDDPEEVAVQIKKSMEMVKDHRTLIGDSYCFNWTVQIPEELQIPFVPTHENMYNLNIVKDMEPYKLAATMRQAFSGIVCGNVKEFGIRQINEKGPYVIRGDAGIMQSMDRLLADFVAQGRFKLQTHEYKPCYKIEM